MKEKTSSIYFYIPKQITILDLTGVVQVFEEAVNLGFNYDLKFISHQTNIKSSSGIEISDLINFSETEPTDDDIVFIFGQNTRKVAYSDEDQNFYQWLRSVSARKATICSVCSGAFLLAESGLLDNKICTIHWDLIDRMKSDFPHIEIKENTLFTKSDNIYTCAGVVTGIDLALSLIEERHGKRIANKVAKELVVYRRRLSNEEQVSVYVENRNHKDEKIHIVQDWIIQNIEKPFTIEDLAELVFVSPRNLTRTFKKQTGVTVSEYRTKLRIEKAKSLLTYSDYKIEYIANLCGYKTSKQLRMVFEKHFKALPTEIKNRLS